MDFLTRKYWSGQRDLFNVKRRFSKNTPVFLYQMGKVASTALERSLRKAYNGSIFRTEILYEKHPNKSIRFLLQKLKENETVKIVSPIREPIGRNVASFFQNLEAKLGKSVSEIDKDFDLQSHFINTHAHQVPIEWFDVNIKKHFAIDVFQYSFSGDHAHIKKEGIEILIFKFDLPDERKVELLSNFLDIPAFNMIKANVGSQKSYAQSYKEFKEKALPKTYVNRMLKSKYAQHFFTGLERDTFKKKWT